MHRHPARAEDATTPPLGLMATYTTAGTVVGTCTLTNGQRQLCIQHGDGENRTVTLVDIESVTLWRDCHEDHGELDVLFDVPASEEAPDGDH